MDEVEDFKERQAKGVRLEESRWFPVPSIYVSAAQLHVLGSARCSANGLHKSGRSPWKGWKQDAVLPVRVL